MISTAPSWLATSGLGRSVGNCEVSKPASAPIQ